MTRALIPSAAGPDAEVRQHRVARLLVIPGSAILALRIVRALALGSIGSLNRRYRDRLRGWSDDPRQLAFPCAVPGLLPLRPADVAARPARAWSR